MSDRFPLSIHSQEAQKIQLYSARTYLPVYLGMIAMSRSVKSDGVNLRE